VGGCEILHQLIGGKHPVIYRVSTILLVVQNFATIHRMVKHGFVWFHIVFPYGMFVVSNGFKCIEHGD